ncbi:hypothetical protein QTP70_032583 [Hemibagrus guttatus]|uniref:Uncharacterized protein n=1 Tax=Hemibagrus guttatus TaxID=175788 RepID=A0AAE0PXZ2_9TELE|nr:hypothetical protein QTP70_032583 [Hemibagrus guttatus]
MFNTYAVMDDGSEQTILLPDAARELGIQGQAESIALRTFHQEVQAVSGLSVSFHISPADQLQKIFKITAAFTAKHLGLANHSYPLSILKKYKHLKDLPLQAFVKGSPLLLIGADNTHLTTPIAPVCLGPPGLKRDVEKLWQLDVLPFQCEKQVTRSREDRQAINFLETKTTLVEVNCILRYATPLLRKGDCPLFQVFFPDLWLSHDKVDPRELTLGLSWLCESDKLGFKHRPVSYGALTRNICWVLASQYDPLGLILPLVRR